MVKSPEGIRLEGRIPLNIMEVGNANAPNREMVQMQRVLLSRDHTFAVIPG